MPLAAFNFKAGVNKEETDYANKGGWVDSNFIRFRKSLPEKIGGWKKLSATAFYGIARALHSWISLGGDRYFGFGTTYKYYIEAGGGYNDVTPERKTSTNSITFAATNGSSTVTVTDSSHGAVNGDFVTFSGVQSDGLGAGGNITQTVLQQEYQIVLVTSANAYTIVAKDTSGNEVTANSDDDENGGAGVDGVYQINSGLDIYIQSTGWGAGTWGESTFGSAKALSATNQLRIWSHDNFGEDLIINVRMGGVYKWVENDGLSTRAVALSGISGANLVPTVGLQVITSETDRHLIVLGADPISGGSRSGSIDPMLIAFSDSENSLEFEPLSTNSAGSVRLSSGSLIVGAAKSRQEILVWTDTSLYSMNFIGPPLTFAIHLINEGTGLIGPKAMANAENGMYWMSKSGFYFYNGSVQRLHSSVQDHVYHDLNLSQAYKCHVAVNSEFAEVWFFYPSIEDGTDEISRYAIFNYEENTWAVGSMVRYAWLDAGIENKPRASGTSSSAYYIYVHENGFDDDTSSMDGVFVESADLDVSNGETFAFVKKLIPDVKFIFEEGVSNTAAMNVVVKRRNFNGESLTTDSTTQVTASSTYTNLRTRTRQLVLRFESDDDNTETNRKGYKWRLGSTRLDVQPSGKRA